MQVDGKYYQVSGPGSLGERVIRVARDRIYADFLRFCRPLATDSIVDVGVSDVVGDAANVMERLYPHPERMTALGLGSGEAFREAYPAIAYRQILAGEPLPYPDKTFDIATANAVLEHVGGFAQQKQFVAELMRVARRVFITVPHRFFPVEHHTAIPFAHWNDSVFRLACRVTGKDEWADRANLILMSRRRLAASVPPGRSARIGATGLPLGPCASNLYLFAES